MPLGSVLKKLLCRRPKGDGQAIISHRVPIIEPEDAVESVGALYPSNKVGYIHRALSAVPETKRDYWRMAEAHYLPGGSVYDFSTDARAISRPQIELIAARVSALHQCLY